MEGGHAYRRLYHSVYCSVDENWGVLTEGKRLRRRGYAPELTDHEVITMEMVVENLGIATDKVIWYH